MKTTMTMAEICELNKKVEDVYAEINIVTNVMGSELTDYRFPNHDGKEDAIVTCELLRLRQRAKALAIICSSLVDELTYVLGMPANDYIRDNAEAHKN